MCYPVLYASVRLPFLGKRYPEEYRRAVGFTVLCAGQGCTCYGVLCCSS
jgi:hypothetical protein